MMLSTVHPSKARRRVEPSNIEARRTIHVQCSSHKEKVVQSWSYNAFYRHYRPILPTFYRPVFYTDIYRPLINTGHRTAGGLQELQTIFPTCQKAAAATMRDGADLMDA